MTLAAVRQRQTISPAMRTAWATGLEFAALMERHFPDVYREHVETCATTTPNLLACAGAFLALAHQHLITLDLDNIPDGVLIRVRSPERAFHDAPRYHPWYRGNRDAEMHLVSHGHRFLEAPSLRLYGLDTDEIVGQNWFGRPMVGRQHILALVLWRLVNGTSWSYLSMPELIRLGGAIGDLDCEALLTRVQPLPQETVLAALCSELDRRQKHLGTTLAYVCRSTGNRFADRALAEQRQARRSLIHMSWSWPDDALTRLRSDQQAAASWTRRYQHLARRAAQDLEFLEGLVALIHETAAGLAGNDLLEREDRYDPRVLRHIIFQLAGATP